MDNPEIVVTLGTRDTGRRQANEKTQHRKLKSSTRQFLVYGCVFKY